MVSEKAHLGMKSLISKEIKPVALAIIKLRLLSQPVENFVKQEISSQLSGRVYR